MGVICDIDIAHMSDRENGMIQPYTYGQVRQGNISYGQSAYGYDARLNDKYKLFTATQPGVVDPKQMDNVLTDLEGPSCVIPPNSYILGSTMEYFRIPRDVVALCVGKSTYARCGIIVNVTPLEPEWEGVVTLEISNSTPNYIRVHAYEGICQFIFFRAEKLCAVSYADRKGKYQGTTGIQEAKV